MSNLRGVYTEFDEFTSRASKIARDLGMPLLNSCDALSKPDTVLLFSDKGLGLWRPQSGESPVVLDFASSEYRSMTLPKSQKQSLLLSAMGRRQRCSILDATAGFGKDAFQLAVYGHEVLLCESSPIMHLLLQDGLERGAGLAACSRMKLHFGDSAELMEKMVVEHAFVDVVYLDPMFPESNSSALVKKELQILRDLIAPSPDNLLAVARQLAKKRVVVKRMKQSPYYAQVEPLESIRGKTNRFDIYLPVKRTSS